jgi:radical SAM protein with 4Fe4S-binding SPASM domain
MLVVFFCFQGENYRKKQEMETEEWRRIFKELAENKCFWVIFSGGEPLMRKDFWELLEFARKNKFVVSIVSNGILLEKEDILKFKKYYIESITISLHAIDKKLCREIYGIEYPLEKIIETISILKKEEVPFNIHVVLNKKNIKEVENIFAFFQNNGISENIITFYPVHPIKDKNYMEFMPSREELLEFYRKHPLPVFKKSSPAFICGAGRNVLRVDSEGNVHICPIFEFPIGNILSGTLKEIWENNLILKLIRKIKSEDFNNCNECEYNLFCETCKAHNWNENGDIFIPSKFNCELAQIFKEVWEEKYGGDTNS